MAEMNLSNGSYTTDLGWVQGRGQDIGYDKLDIENESLSKLSAIDTDNPYDLASHPTGQFLYACNEASHHHHPAATDDRVRAFAIANDGSLSLINHRPSNGAAP